MDHRHQIADLADRQLPESPSSESPRRAPSAYKFYAGTLQFGDLSAGRKCTEQRERRFFSYFVCNGQAGKNSDGLLNNSKNTRLVKYSDNQVGLVHLSDAACGNCIAVAGFQGFFTGESSARGGYGQGSCSGGEGRSVGEMGD